MQLKRQASSGAAKFPVCSKIMQSEAMKWASESSGYAGTCQFSKIRTL
jgi:hypothetical protein